MFYAIDRNTKKHRMTAKSGPISVNEYIVQADADGWIKWNGGDCPLPDDCRHQVKHDGDVCDDNRPQTWCWSDKKLTHYRPILEEDKPTQWHGPQDGLPPIGEKVKLLGHSNLVEVVAHGIYGNFCGRGDVGDIAIFHISGIEPIRTPEQIAEERAVEAIKEQACTDQGTAEAAYIAVRDGLIPGVKLESQ